MNRRSVMPGLYPGIHLLCKTILRRRMDCRVISAFTRVFDALCPAMTFLNSGVAQGSHARLEISIPALLRRLLPGVAVALGFRLEAQVSPLLAVARAVAENLLLAGEILRRTMDARGAVPGRRLHAEIRVDEVRARQRDEIGAAGGDDGVDLVGGGDRADALRGKRGVVADLIGKRRLEHATEDRLRVGDGLSGRHVDEIATS